ncbi:hypothetical protein H4R24_000445 [Coemansia sp. RSA 988]|nr:hypothetical protein H4R24_000445 [Coemansia sp. RSA 988]
MQLLLTFALLTATLAQASYVESKPQAENTMVQTVQVPAVPVSPSGSSPVAYVANPPPAIPSIVPIMPSPPAPAIPAISSAPSTQPMPQTLESTTSSQEQLLVINFSPVLPQPTNSETSVDAEQTSEAMLPSTTSCEESSASWVPAPVVPIPLTSMLVEPTPSMPAPEQPMPEQSSVDAEQASESAPWPESSPCADSASWAPAPVEPMPSVPMPSVPMPSVPMPVEPMPSMPAPVEPMPEQSSVDAEQTSESAPWPESSPCADSASWAPAPSAPALEIPNSPVPAPVIVESTIVMSFSPEPARTFPTGESDMTVTFVDEVQYPSPFISSECEDETTTTRVIEFTGTPAPSMPVTPAPQPAAPAIAETNPSEDSSIDAIAEESCLAPTTTVTVQADASRVTEMVTETSYVVVYSYVLPYAPGPVILSSYPEIPAVPTQITAAPAIPMNPAPPAPTDESSEPCTSL